MTAWIMVKIAVVPPIPSASVTVTAAVNIGDIRNCRKAYRRLVNMFYKSSPYIIRDADDFVSLKQRGFVGNPRHTGYSMTITDLQVADVPGEWPKTPSDNDAMKALQRSFA